MSDGKGGIKNLQDDFNWNEIKDSITISEIKGRNVYSVRFDYYSSCFEDFKMTDEGHVSIYKCCGI